ncbi:MAG: glyoxylate/hydroxypyruvate reductase A [Alphaproteobacteria bacterium]|nr:glyoxylate/hydroxypyruvate reductase A [Alphaproteobacteria bacterium]
MALMITCAPARLAAWKEALGPLLPGVPLRAYPQEVADPAEIRWAVVWNHPLGDLRRYPNLELVASMGAGVDHIFRDPDLPPGVPIMRLVDRLLTTAMSEYVLLAVLRHHRQDAGYRAQQAARLWRELPAPDTEATRIGILGLGVLGTDAAAKLAALKFPVAGWSRRAKSLPGIESFAGEAGLAPFLARTDILVCLLPLTPATRGIVNARTLGALPRGAYVINAARGGHVVDADLLAALESGQISGATLDVFNQEPLPPDSPYWSHPRVVMTPHTASITVPRSVAPQIAENIGRLARGQPLINLVDSAAGY